MPKHEAIGNRSIARELLYSHCAYRIDDIIGWGEADETILNMVAIAVKKAVIILRPVVGVGFERILEDIARLRSTIDG